jgi:hypothetical protein
LNSRALGVLPVLAHNAPRGNRSSRFRRWIVAAKKVASTGRGNHFPHHHLQRRDLTPVTASPLPCRPARWQRLPREENRLMTIKFVANDKGNPPGKLADAELHFTEGPLEGLKLIGFAVWERKTGGGRNVTFPARQYSVNGERRSFALLRPMLDSTAQNRIRDAILAAYEEFVTAQMEATA